MSILMVASYVWIPLQTVSLHNDTDPQSILEQRVGEGWSDRGAQPPVYMTAQGHHTSF